MHYSKTKTNNHASNSYHPAHSISSRSNQFNHQKNTLKVMKNIVIIIKNLPDNLVNEGLVGGMKQLEMDIDPKKPMELDWQTSGDIEKARLIEAIVKIQSNYAYTLLRKMPMEQRHRVMAILARDTSEKFFQNNFGNFNLN